MSNTMLSLAALGVLAMWIFILASIFLGSACLYALCCRSCIEAVYRFTGVPGDLGKEEPEWKARVLCAFLAYGSMDIGLRGIRYLLETTSYVVCLYNVR